ncbi:uncharacterized protein LOC110440421 isoform X2 [Mizuhopecten yessoensis]|uniref:uncharacterized protein LOC110440421 isoform X2 n=1 Tax=Mizuhopecten yessoensis TaxID=6573 RepID=UPI000B45CD86|nr:uncharacterized protein LOC110440421 isoform X2 [Mizuhopecten yessoensis]
MISSFCSFVERSTGIRSSLTVLSKPQISATPTECLEPSLMIISISSDRPAKMLHLSFLSQCDTDMSPTPEPRGVMKICTGKDSCVMEDKTGLPGADDALGCGDKPLSFMTPPKGKKQVTLSLEAGGGEDYPDDDMGEFENDGDEAYDDVFLPDDYSEQMDSYVGSEGEYDDASTVTVGQLDLEEEEEACTHERSYASGSLQGETTPQWNNQLEYILACSGFMSGLYSALKFPELARIHGGGVFFVAYLILVMVCGFPLLYMEMILGQYSRGGPITAWDVVPLFRGLGFSMILVSVMVSVYNHVSLLYALYYLVTSLMSLLPWTCLNPTDQCWPFLDVNQSSQDDVYHETYTSLSSHNVSTVQSFPLDSISDKQHQYFYDDVLHISSGVEALGEVQWPLGLCLVGVWTLTFVMTIAGPRSFGKVVYMTYGLSVVLYLSLLARCCLEEGAITGIQFFLSLQWSTLGNLQLWTDVGQLVFMSMGLGTGCWTTLASYTHFHSHCFRNSVMAVLAHLFGVILTGFTMFSMLGVYSHMEQTDIPSLTFSSWELAFTIFPSVLNKMEASRVWIVILFLLLVLTGLHAQCVYVQNVLSGLLLVLKNKKLFRWKYLLQGVTCVTLMTLGLLFTSQAGLYLTHLVTSCACRLDLFLVSLAECLVLTWLYGTQRLSNNVADMTGNVDSPWWKITWQIFTPLAILAILVLTIVNDSRLTYKTYLYPDWITPIGWIFTLILVSPVPIEMIRVFAKGSDPFVRRIKRLKATPIGWGPGPLANQEPDTDLPEYVICTPDIYKPHHALALLTANLYIPNLSNLVTAVETEDADMTNGYLSELTTLDSGDSEEPEEDSNYRGNWSSRLDFVLSCLGYVVGLGNVWRFPYLVYKNGGGAFFIPYAIMLVFCGVPLVYLELAFGQYASLGPITVWKAVPLFKGIGISMVLSSAIVSVYYNMVNAWAFHFLFASMTGVLPWLGCDNYWNTEACSTNQYRVDNCSWINQTYFDQENFTLNDSCVSVVTNCSYHGNNETQLMQNCIESLQGILGKDILLDEPKYDGSRASPTEEYFFNRVLGMAGHSLGNLGYIQWELALCLMLAWLIVFVCLVKGIRTSGKVAYCVVTFPYIIIFALLIRAFMMEGYMQGIKFYVTPKWERLKEPGVWADAAVQVFFSLSACMGGLTTLASYNKFHNNIYSDAILVCLGDTLMSVLAGFSVFAMMGVLSNELNTSVENVIASGVGLTFIVNPAAMSFLPAAPLWSLLFFLMIVMLGLSTQFVNIETVITAIIDENITLLRRRRVLVVSIVCGFLFLLGLPLTTQGGMYVLQLMDEYAAGFPILINGIFVCVAIGWVYGVKQFSRDIKHMVGRSVSYWWQAMWCVMTPLIIIFILIFSVIGYEPLSIKYDTDAYPDWAEILGFIITLTPVIAIPVCGLFQVISKEGSLLQRLQKSCHSESNWGPALERHWKNIEYFPTVNTHTIAEDIEHSLLHTVSDNVDFTTVGVRVPSLSQTSLLPKSLSPKKPRDMRERAILNHAYSNPQCHQSTASIEKSSLSSSSSSTSSCHGDEKVPSSSLHDEKLPSCSHNDNFFFGPDIIVVPRNKTKVQMCNASTQTDLALTRKLSSQKHPTTSSRKSSTSSFSTHSASHHSNNDSPAVLQVEVTQL